MNYYLDSRFHGNDICSEISHSRTTTLNFDPTLIETLIAYHFNRIIDRVFLLPFAFRQ